jgi:hypothetical protein
MNPTSPARTSSTRSSPGPASPPNPRRAAPPQSCSRDMSSATFTRTAARSTFPFPPTDARKRSKQDGPRNGSPAGFSKQLASLADADDGIALLRESYDAQRAPRASAAKSRS